MAYVIVWDITSISLIGICVFLLFLLGFLYINKTRTHSDKEGRIFLLGMGLFFICLGIALSITIASLYSIPGYFENYAFYSDMPDDIAKINASGFNKFLGALQIIQVLGFTCVLFSFEYIERKTHYILSVISVLMIILNIIASFYTYEIISLVGVLCYFFYILAIMFALSRLSKRSDKELRMMTAMLLFGFLTYAVGFTLLMEPNIYLPVTFAPTIAILGVVMNYIPFLITPERFSRLLKYWLIIGSGIIGFIWYIQIIVFIYGMMQDDFINMLTVLSALLYTFYFSMKVFREKSISPNLEKVTTSSVMNALTKPKKFSEEEVTISKEKKICLVCKNKIIGINFVCKVCETFYCNKCYKALSDMENVCWACESALDDFKPQKLQKDEIDDLELEEGTKIQKLKK